MATKWKPLGGTEWLQLPGYLLGEPLPDRPATTPRKRQGLPEHVPYHYHGADFSLPAEVTVIARPRRRTARPATWLDDPALRYPACPVSAPAWWIHEHEQGEM